MIKNNNLTSRTNKIDYDYDNNAMPFICINGHSTNEENICRFGKALNIIRKTCINVLKAWLKKYESTIASYFITKTILN